jgi:hypothetical protein
MTEFVTPPLSATKIEVETAEDGLTKRQIFGAKGELMECLRAVQCGIDALLRTIGLSMPDATGRLRVVLDAAGGAQTLATVTTVGTVSTITAGTITTVTTLTGQTNMGSYAANEQIPALMQMNWQGLRRNIAVS